MGEGVTLLFRGIVVYDEEIPCFSFVFNIDL